MNLTYKDTHDFTKEELEDLFLSVEWSSGKYPEKLVISMKNFKTVYSAYDNDKLVGLICVMDDGIMNAYIHYLLVNPKYQKYGIGKDLVEKVKVKYKDYLRIAVIGYGRALGFYEKCGFTKSNESYPMFITSLWT
ncbi:MAG: GNAT family N-acetyltransferase [Acholeplasmatales bacterium]|nr:GNAT family N-acetyltransferase [Acholeplasmatales bacterium]